MNAFRFGSIGDIPLFVSPWYLLIALYGATIWGDVAVGGLWVLCLTVSLLVHELGHAMVARHYRLGPRIMLHGFGGLCIHERAERDAHDAWIIAAGPAAGLALGFIALATRAALRATDSPALDAPLVGTGLGMLVWLNVFWSLVNLVPLWPLDGGQLFRLGMLHVTRPIRAERVTHGLGVALGLAAVVTSLVTGYAGLATVIAAGITWINLQALRGERSSGPVRSRATGARTAARAARDAFDRGDWAEAARLGHLVRAEPNIPAEALRDVWRILGLATARLDRPREAVSWLRRAPLDLEVGETWLRCLLELQADDEIRALLGSPDWAALGPEGQAIVNRLAIEHG